MSDPEILEFLGSLPKSELVRLRELISNPPVLPESALQLIVQERMTDIGPLEIEALRDAMILG